MGAESRVGRMFGHYKIIGLIGRGGMGEVYEAQDTRKGRTVALKILPEQYSQDERFRARFQRESRAAAILQEQHVIPIHDWGEIDGNLYIDMRLVQGKTLHELLADGPLEPARAVHIISEVGAALDAAHAAGLIHRDVKPQNVIVTTSDFPYLVDFGIAEATGEVGLTMTGMNIGTLHYMAPERFGDADATPAVDVYALTCVLYETLTGDTPFPAGSMERTLAAHLTSAPPRPSALNPRVPTSMDAVIARGMAKDPLARYPSASALGEAAKAALESGGSGHPSRPPYEPFPSSPPTAYASVPPVAYQPQAQPPARPTPHPYSQPPSYSQPPPYHQQPPYGGQQPYNHAQPQQFSTGPTDYLPPAGGSDKPWLMPVIAVVAVVLLGTLGVLIGLMLSGDDAQDPDAGGTESSRDRVTVTAGAPPSGDSTPPESPPTPAEVPLNQGAAPPAVRGPDGSSGRVSCDGGFLRSGAPGPGNRAVRGSEGTSCQFAENVLNAYWDQYGNATREARTVYARGAIDCVPGPDNRNGCRGAEFIMTCVGRPGDAFITCEGGRLATVYIY